ncbi:MAG: hypothetical protein JXA78_07095 [Anaerolineales bacterium]|nr:hypothetical protein [Anaerolineales bacterium]
MPGERLNCADVYAFGRVAQISGGFLAQVELEQGRILKIFGIVQKGLAFCPDLCII